MRFIQKYSIPIITTLIFIIIFLLIFLIQDNNEASDISVTEQTENFDYLETRRQEYLEVSSEDENEPTSNLGPSSFQLSPTSLAAQNYDPTSVCPDDQFPIANECIEPLITESDPEGNDPNTIGVHSNGDVYYLSENRANRALQLEKFNLDSNTTRAIYDDLYLDTSENLLDGDRFLIKHVLFSNDKYYFLLDAYETNEYLILSLDPIRTNQGEFNISIEFRTEDTFIGNTIPEFKTSPEGKFYIGFSDGNYLLRYILIIENDFSTSRVIGPGQLNLLSIAGETSKLYRAFEFVGDRMVFGYQWNERFAGFTYRRYGLVHIDPETFDVIEGASTEDFDIVPHEIYYIEETNELLVSGGLKSIVLSNTIADGSFPLIAEFNSRRVSAFTQDESNMFIGLINPPNRDGIFETEMFVYDFESGNSLTYNPDSYTFDVALTQESNDLIMADAPLYPGVGDETTTIKRFKFKEPFDLIIPEEEVVQTSYFTWNDTSRPGRNVWNLVGNPTSEDLRVNLNISNGLAVFNTLIGAGMNEAKEILNVQGGPISIKGDTGFYSTQRVLFEGSFNEFEGIKEDELTDKYFFTWYDDRAERESYAWILIGNPSETENATVEVKINGNILGSHIIGAGQNAAFRYDAEPSGPVEVTEVNGRNIYTTQRTLTKGSFNEYAGIPANQLTNEYYFTWYDNRPSRNNLTWILVGNPNNEATEVEIYKGADLLDTIIVEAKSNKALSYDNILDGPIRVKSKDGSNIYTTQRTIIKGSFNEYAGIPANQLTNEYYFTWYDTRSSRGNITWLMIGNPSDTSVDVDIFIEDLNTPKRTVTIEPNSFSTEVFSELLGGPVKIKSQNGELIYTSQRALIGTSFNEYPGID